MIVWESQEPDTMLRSQLVRRSALAALTAMFVAAPIKLVLATAPQDSGARPENQNLSPEQRYKRRYPQPVKAAS